MTSRKRRPLSGALMRAFSERQFDSTLTTTSGETATAPSANRLTTDTSIPIFQTLSSSNWQQQQVPDLVTSSDFRKTNAPTDVAAVVHASGGGRVLRRALVHPDDESNRQLTRKSHSASLMTSSNGGQTLKVCFGGSDVVGMAEMAPDGTKISPSAVSEDCSSAYLHHYRPPPTYDRANSINLSIASSTSVYRTPSGGTCSSMTTTTYRSSVDNRSILSDRQSTPTVSAALPSSKALCRSTFGQKSIKKMENRSDSEPRTKAELIRWRRVDNETIPLMPAVVSLDETVFPVPAHELVLSTSNFENGSSARIESQSQLLESSTALIEQPILPVVYPSTAVKFKVAKSDMEICRHWERRQHSSEFTDVGGGGISSSASRTKTVLNDQTKFGVRRRQTRLRINVSGQHFEIGRNALARHPTTLLGDDDRRRRYYDMERDELFLDRHRPSFEAIFAYYQTGGRVRRPYNVPDDVFLAELTFYQLEPEVVDEYKRSEGYVFEQVPLPDSRWMRHVWMLFEYPDTSKAAFCVAVISVVITLVSIVLFCIETHEAFSTSHCLDNDVPNFADPFFVIETICTAWFTVEAIVRFVSCPSKFAFWRDFKNIVDVTAIIPYYVTLFNVLSTMSCSSAKSSASLSFLRVIRLVRVFKLTKHSVGLQILVMTFKASLEGLGLFLVALFVSLLVFSSAIYYAELGEKNTQMSSIPDAFWWAIITMTTVGYGDKVPVGYAGRLVGAACAITGVLTLAIPVPIITGHFNRFYSHKTGRGRHV